VTAPHESTLQQLFQMLSQINRDSTVRQQHRAPTAPGQHHSPPNIQPAKHSALSSAGYGSGLASTTLACVRQPHKVADERRGKGRHFVVARLAHPISEKECPPISEASALGQITDTDYTSKCKPSLLNWTGTPTPHTLSLYVGWPSSHLLDTTSS